MIRIGSPGTPAELEAYFTLRWRILRAPWGQPLGSERDEHDAPRPDAGGGGSTMGADSIAAAEPIAPDRPVAPARAIPSAAAAASTEPAASPQPVAAVIHATARDDSGRLIAIGRLHFNSSDEAQIRYMATIETHRGRGAGRAIVEYLESAARARGARRIVLAARDTAIGFYERLGYAAIGAGPLLFGEIPHTRMQKRLEPDRPEA